MYAISSAVKSVCQQAKVDEYSENQQQTGVDHVPGHRAVHPGIIGQKILMASVATEKVMVQLDLTILANRTSALKTLPAGNPGCVKVTIPGCKHDQW
jgi:hypothetical protein